MLLFKFQRSILELIHITSEAIYRRCKLMQQFIVNLKETHKKNPQSQKKKIINIYIIFMYTWNKDISNRWQDLREICSYTALVISR